MVWFSEFWTKLSRRISFPHRPRSKIPYLFPLNCGKTVSSPTSKFLGRFSAVKNVRQPKVLYSASPFTNTISRSDYSLLLISLIVEYEIANNGMQTHWMPAVSPKTTFLWLNDPWTTLHSPVAASIMSFYSFLNNGEMITSNSEGFLIN